MQRTLLSLVYFLVCSISLAQQYPFVHYGPKEGLADNRVRKIFQDSKGRMYFLTYEGLSVYDGTRFTNYTTENGLAINLVNDIMECGDDSLLLAVNAHQLQVLVRGDIKTLSLQTKGELPVINHFCKGENGNIYLATDLGLYVLQGNQISKFPFDRLSTINPSVPLVKLLYMRNFLLVLGNPGDYYPHKNLFLYDLSLRKIINEYDHTMITDMAYGPDSTICVSSPTGVHVINPALVKKRTLISFPSETQLQRGFNPGSSIFSDAKKNIWITHVTLGLIRIGYDKKVQYFTPANGISSSFISYVYRDRESNVWLANEEKGVDKLTSEGIRIYPANPRNPINYISSTLTGDTVLLLDWKNNSITLVGSGMEKKISLPSDWDVNTAMINKGRLYAWNWLTIYTADLDNRGRRIRPQKFRIEDPEKYGLFNGAFDLDGNLILTCNTKLALFNAAGQFQYYPLDDFIDQLTIDPTGRIWVITRSDNLYVFEHAESKSSDSLHLVKVFRREVDGGFRSITYDRKNRVWIGTRFKGVWCLQIDKDLNIVNKKQFSVKDGLTNNFAADIQCDADNNLWISSPSGLDKLSWNDNKNIIESVTRANNIYQYVLKTVIAPDGEITALTSTGNLIKVKTQTSVPTFYEPRLLITYFRVNNIKADSFYSGIQLKYTENNLSFDIAAPAFTDEKQVKYSYCLNTGNNYHCSEYSNNGTINLAGLNPGKYGLWLRVTFPGNKYVEKQLRFTFTILPPWWQTWWVRMLAILLFAGTIVLIIRGYFNRKLQKQKIVLEKKQAVEKERTRIATDIHDDLGSGLSRIRYLGETIRLKTSQQQDIIPDIEKISEFSDEMVDKMNEIVWALNEKNDTLAALLYYIRSFTVEYLSGNKINCKINIPETIPPKIINGETRRNIFLSVKESLHNIVKHAQATEAQLEVALDKYISIVIRDNGCGIQWDQVRPFSNGISNIRKRMDEVKGTVLFHSNGGTEVLLKIPIY